MSGPLTLTLHDTSGEPVPVEVVAVDRESSGAFVATFHVTLDVWRHVDEGELFHTERARRVGDVEGRFEDGRPVEIEVTLDDLVVESLGLADATADDLRARLAAIETKTLDEFLLATRSWYARSVVQEVPLPEELAATGTISQGFRMD